MCNNKQLWNPFGSNLVWFFGILLDRVTTRVLLRIINLGAAPEDAPRGTSTLDAPVGWYHRVPRRAIAENHPHWLQLRKLGYWQDGTLFGRSTSLPEEDSLFWAVHIVDRDRHHGWMGTSEFHGNSTKTRQSLSLDKRKNYSLSYSSTRGVRKKNVFFFFFPAR